MCNRAVEKSHGCCTMFLFILGHKKCVKKAVEKCLKPLKFNFDHLKIQEICEKAVEKDPYQLGDFSDRFKTKRMCEKLLKMNQKP